MHKKEVIGISIVVALIIGYYLYTNLKPKVYTKTLFYMDTVIEVKVYSNNQSQATKALDGVDQLYQKYNNLSDYYQAYDDLVNIYYINHNDDDSAYLKIAPELYDLISYGLSFKDQSNGLLDIGLGCVINLWHTYREQATGIPSTDELALCNEKPIVLGDNYTILNNHPNIDLGAIAKGYATKEASAYLESQGIKTYLINAGGNVSVGDYYQSGYYKIGIMSPITNESFITLKVTNKAIVTSGSYERYYEYDGVRYSHIIDPNTKYPANYMQSVTVISDDSALADALSTTLFLMPIDEGQLFIKDYEVDAIWFANDGTIYKTSGVAQYE